MEGRKDVLGMYVGQNESAKLWLSILNGLKNRGVEDILVACVDGLSGFAQAIGAVYPQTGIQQCIIHQIRNTTWKVIAVCQSQTILQCLQFLSRHDLAFPEFTAEYPLLFWRLLLS